MQNTGATLRPLIIEVRREDKSPPAVTESNQLLSSRIMMDLHKLTTLGKVIELGSVTLAADELKYTPSAVSQQIKRLEKDIGQPVLRRQGHRVIATDAGLALAERARRIMVELDAAESELSAIRSGHGGTISIGSFPTLAASFLPKVIKAFASSHPHVKLEIVSARYDDLLENLKRGTTNISFLWDTPWSPLNADGVKAELLYSEESVVVVPKTHPLADEKEVELEQLRDEKWILRTGQHPVMETLRHAAAHARFRPEIAMHVNDYQEAQALVSVGMGVLMVPHSAVALRHPDVCVLSLGKEAPTRRVLVARRNGHKYSPVEEAFLSVLHQLAK